MMKMESGKRKSYVKRSTIFTLIASLFTVSILVMRIYFTEHRFSEEDQAIATLSETVRVQRDMLNKMELDISYLKLVISRQQATKNLSSSHHDSMLKLEGGESNNTQLQKMVEDHHQLLEALRADLESVEEKDEILSAKISQAANIFDYCHTEVDTCVIGSTGNGRYWKDCPTKFFPNEADGYMTVGKWCSYRSSVTDYSETLTLFEKDGQVRCDCDVTLPGDKHPGQRPVKDVDATCVLTIVRCPITVKH